MLTRSLLSWARTSPLQKQSKSMVDEGKIRHWRVKDSMELGTPMNAGSWVCDIVVLRDGKWIVSGTM